MMEEVIESNKRGAKLCHAGYMYTKTSVRKKKIWWKCSKRGSLNCCASISTSLDSKNPIPRIHHNHQPEEAEIEYAKFRNSMKKRLQTKISPLLSNTDEDDDNLQHQPFDEDKEKNANNVNNDNNVNWKQNNNNNNPKSFFCRKRKVYLRKNSVRNFTENRNRFFSSQICSKAPMRPSTFNQTILQRLNHSVMKSTNVQNKRQGELLENGKTIFPPLQMNFGSGPSVKSSGIKRTASISLAGTDSVDIKPFKRQMNAQKSIQMAHPHSSQGTAAHQTLSQIPQVSLAQKTHLQLPPVHQNHLQMAANIQNQQPHSKVSIGASNHHMTNGQLNPNMSINHLNYSIKTDSTDHPGPFPVPMNMPSHQMKLGSKVQTQNVSLGHLNSHPIMDQQSQAQINLSSQQKSHQSSLSHLRFLENGPSNRSSHVEASNVMNQQQNEALQDTLKLTPISSEAHCNKTFPSDMIKSTKTPCTTTAIVTHINNKKTFNVLKHQHNVMSSLASLWKDSRLCDASIGNKHFKIMVHKLVLLAISPKLLSQADIKANCFIRITLPEQVSQAALIAFSEYMYHGVLTLDPVLLQQLRIVAQQLGIRELELLCDIHLLYSNQQSSPTEKLTPAEINTTSLVESFTEMSTDISVKFPVKQEEGHKEVSLGRSLKDDLSVPIKTEPVDPIDQPSSHTDMVNSDLKNNSHFESSTQSWQYNDQFNPAASEFELLSPIQVRQDGASSDSFAEINDILQLQKLFKKSELSSFSSGGGDCVVNTGVSLSLNSDPVDHNLEFSTNCHVTSIEDSNPVSKNFGGQSLKHSVISNSERTSQDSSTFQITDIRSVEQTVDLT